MSMDEFQESCCFPLDLHLHSTCSDGTDEPLQLVEAAKRAGLKLIALTDHDTDKGYWTLAKEGLLDQEPRVLRGVEVSCKDDYGKYHILGYHFDPKGTRVPELIRRMHEARMRKLELRLKFLRDTYGFVFTPDEIAALRALDNPGKPHIGNLMVKKGYAVSRSEAIEGYMSNMGRMKVGIPKITPKEALEAIRADGGISVLAHPLFGNGSQRLSLAEGEERVARLHAYGLEGLECYYSRHTRQQTEGLLDIAGRLDMYVTAGSDYHGKNKNIPLGQTGMEKGEPIPSGMRRFLEAVNR